MLLFKEQEKGQGVVEYALILVLVSVVVLAVLFILCPVIGNVFSEINSGLQASGDVAVSAPPAVIEGAEAQTQYCAERPGYVGGVNWGSAVHSWTTDGQTYSVTGIFSCP